MKTAVAAVAVLSSLTAGAAAQSAFDLSAGATAAAIAACRAMAIEEGWRVAVAVKDIGGNLVAFERMDGAFAKAGDLTLLKAETASTTPLSTARMREVVYGRGGAPHGLELTPGVAVFDGGEPIRDAQGVQIGGLGVSGATSADDGRCARRAVEAIGSAAAAAPTTDAR